jgi:SNF2 family DNA or RNA helicase
VTLLADDVGLGKTISAGLVASELMSRNRISKFLVVCPQLLMPQWEELLVFCARDFALRDRVVMG